jgi:hypothetical protein
MVSIAAALPRHQRRASVYEGRHIYPPVVDVVAHGCTHAGYSTRYARPIGDIGEGASAIVLAQSFADGLPGLEEIAQTTIHQMQVQPTLVAVIQKTAAQSRCLGQEAVFQVRMSMSRGDTAHSRRNTVKNRGKRRANRKRSAE